MDLRRVYDDKIQVLFLLIFSFEPKNNYVIKVEQVQFYLFREVDKLGGMTSTICTNW